MTLLSFPLPEPKSQWRVTQRFGENPAYYARFGLAGHEGIDLSCVTGTLVHAAHRGAITVLHSDGGYGRHVRVRDDKVETLYAHLSHIEVQTGMAVTEGTVLGRSGATGNVTGPHLHFGVKPHDESVNNGYKGYVDPWPYLYGDEIMAPSSKLGLHFQNIPPWAWQVKESRIEFVKLIDPPSGDSPFPGKSVIGRAWIGGDGVEAEYVRRREQGAEEYFTLLQLKYADTRYVHAWEGPNEPHPLHDPQFRNDLSAFSRRWVQLMHQAGYLTVTCSFSVGWPQEGTVEDLVGCFEETDYWGLHEYSAPMMQDGDGWLTLRYRRTVAEMRYRSIRVPPLLITETGIDGGVLNPPKVRVGWKGFGWSREEYEAQLAWYDEELKRDEYVVAATPFVSGPNPEWALFDVDSHIARWIADRHEHATDPILEEAEKHVIPMVPGFALWDYITARGWILASNEFTIGNWNYQWGFDVNRNERTLCRAQAPNWRVEQYATVEN